MVTVFMLLVVIMISVKHCKSTIFGLVASLISFSPTEIWSFDDNDNAITMKLAEPSLYQYYSYPELFIVDSDFCTKK